jgi:hypothetical protein
VRGGVVQEKVIVEYKRFRGKKIEKGEREGRRINITTIILSYKEIEGSCFLLPFLESIKRG